VNKVGPSLWNVVGRRIAAVPDYNYSEKLRSAANCAWDVWDDKHLETYLSNPRQVLHGVKMFFAARCPPTART
jgi:cytochrome c